ncbi:hypothetical protein KFZ70_08665 [Tamlana fucoidanivorans]|uniref:DUF4382 domain-containing protein n=1 Tax=Allotamlana fucoidanivorans TaxID=2583814 RepID=A0A5C4SRG0_9FLAO|nr:hypothetical protein [Tamlana fucoidanivorans]TNJ46167.1 hypothetical protein FGF67_04015 [Tamlana fucoidanivorans]
MATFSKPSIIYALVTSLLISCFISACKSDKKENKTENPKKEKPKHIVITTESMDFNMPDTISSGWNTFVYQNKSPQTHFFIVDKYPEGKTSKDVEELIAPIFDKGMQLIMQNKAEDGFAEFANLPEWFSDVVFLGGSGLLSPNHTSSTTIHLNPGKYIVECYVKMSNGVFHTSMGMVKDLVVSPEVSLLQEPIADKTISISSTKGIIIDTESSITPGNYTFAVNFEDQIKHEHFVGHDINLVKIHNNADLKVLENWMNWANPQGLIEPAPENFTFLGGVNDMPSGHKGYFKVNLDEGHYAFISEVPDPSGKNMLKRFQVSN